MACLLKNHLNWNSVILGLCDSIWGRMKRCGDGETAVCRLLSLSIFHIRLSNPLQSQAIDSSALRLIHFLFLYVKSSHHSILPRRCADCPCIGRAHISLMRVMWIFLFGRWTGTNHLLFLCSLCRHHIQNGNLLVFEGVLMHNEARLISDQYSVEI